MIRRSIVIGLFQGCCLALTTGAVAAAVPPVPPLPPAPPAMGAAVPVQVVFTTIAGHPSAAVPGDRSLVFRPASDGRFGRPVASPDGRRWVVRAAVEDADGVTGEVILVGDAEGAVVAARTGQPAPGSGGVFAAFADELSIGDDGVFQFRATVRAGADSVGADPAVAAVEGAFRGRVGGEGDGALPVLAPAPEPGAGPVEPPVAEVEPEAGAEVVAFTIEALVVTPAGDWLARGTDDSGKEWVFRNGEPVATGGAPVTLAPGEHESFAAASPSPAFFSMNVNGQGDIVIGGITDAGDGSAGGRGAAVILNNQRVILREGDPVDLDGDGVADDGAFIHAFSADGAFLGDGGWYTFSATVRDGAGRILGEGLLRAAVCKPDWDASGAPNSSDISAFITAWVVSIAEGLPLADYNRDGVADSADVVSFLAGWMDAVGGGC